MKKVLLLIIVMMFLVLFGASAEIDLSGLTLNELVELKSKIDTAIWECDEWEEVLVPQGVYEIGVDIPAGKWTIEPADMVALVNWGTRLEKNGTKCSTDIAFDVIVSEDYDKYQPTQDITHVDYDLKNGQYICIEGNSVLFKPYTGKNLGFTFR